MPDTTLREDYAGLVPGVVVERLDLHNAAKTEAKKAVRRFKKKIDKGARASRP